MLHRPRQPREEDTELLGKRRSRRVRIALPAYAETVSGRKNVRLLNLSTTGALLDGPFLPAKGQDVVVKCGATDAFGVVVWSADGQCGIHFDEPIDPADVERHWVEGQQCARSGMSPEQEQAARDWVQGRIR